MVTTTTDLNNLFLHIQENVTEVLNNAANFFAPHFSGSIFQEVKTSILIHPSAQDDSLFGTMQIVAHPTEEAINEDFVGNIDLDLIMTQAWDAAISQAALLISEAFILGCQDAQFNYELENRISWTFQTKHIPLCFYSAQRKDNSLHIIISDQA